MSARTSVYIFAMAIAGLCGTAGQVVAQEPSQIDASLARTARAPLLSSNSDSDADKHRAAIVTYGLLGLLLLIAVGNLALAWYGNKKLQKGLDQTKRAPSEIVHAVEKSLNENLPKREPRPIEQDRRWHVSKGEWDDLARTLHQVKKEIESQSTILRSPDRIDDYAPAKDEERLKPLIGRRGDEDGWGSTSNSARSSDSPELIETRELLLKGAQQLGTYVQQLGQLTRDQATYTDQLRAIEERDQLLAEVEQLRTKNLQLAQIESDKLNLEALQKQEIVARSATEEKLQTALKAVDRLNEREKKYQAATRELKDQLERLTEDRKNIEVRSAELSEVSERYRKESTTYRHLWNSLLLRPFADGELQDWREKLQSPKPSFALVLNSIHRCKILLQSDERQLAKALYELGESLYRLLSELGFDDSRIAETAERWARAIEKECDGKCNLQIARVGDAKNQTWMNSPPDPAPVRQVFGWCVNNGKYQALQKAPVK
jgi:hypothetical protein